MNARTHHISISLLIPRESFLDHLGEMGFVNQAGWKVGLEVIPESDNLELRELCHLGNNDDR